LPLPKFIFRQLGPENRSTWHLFLSYTHTHSLIHSLALVVLFPLQFITLVRAQMLTPSHSRSRSLSLSLSLSISFPLQCLSLSYLSLLHTHTHSLIHSLALVVLFPLQFITLVRAQMWQMNPDILGKEQKDVVYEARRRLVAQFPEASGLPGYHREEIHSLIMEMHRKNRKKLTQAFRVVRG
jgi:hypothetical protein